MIRAANCLPASMNALWTPSFPGGEIRQRHHIRVRKDCSFLLIITAPEWDMLITCAPNWETSDFIPDQVARFH